MQESPQSEPRSVSAGDEVLQRFTISLPLEPVRYEDAELFEWFRERLRTFRTLNTAPLFVVGQENGALDFDISRLGRMDTIQPEHIGRAVRETLKKALNSPEELDIPEYFDLPEAEVALALEEVWSTFRLAKVITGNAAIRQQKIAMHRQLIRDAMLEIPTVLRRTVSHVLRQLYLDVSPNARRKAEEHQKHEQLRQVQKAIEDMQAWIRNSWEDYLLPIIELNHRYDVLKDVPHPCLSIGISRRSPVASRVSCRMNDLSISLCVLPPRGEVELHYYDDRNEGGPHGCIKIWGNNDVTRSNSSDLKGLRIDPSSDELWISVEEPNVLEITPEQARKSMVEWLGGDPLFS